MPVLLYRYMYRIGARATFRHHARAEEALQHSEPEPAKEEKNETTDPKSDAVSFSIEMTADEYFEYRTTKEAAEKRATFSADQ